MDGKKHNHNDSKVTTVAQPTAALTDKGWALPATMSTKPPAAQAGEQHYLFWDNELCDYAVGPLLSSGILHASYSRYKYTFHSFFQNSCFRDKKMYTKDGLDFWSKRQNNAAHKWMFEQSKHVSPDDLKHRMLQYVHAVGQTAPTVTHLYDDPHADFTMTQLFLQTCLQLRDGKYKPQWKCSRDLIRGAFRMIHPEFESLHADDMNRILADDWNALFRFADDPKEKEKKTDPRQVVTRAYHFDESTIPKHTHIPAWDALVACTHFFRMEDLRCSLQPSILPLLAKFVNPQKSC